MYSATVYSGNQSKNLTQVATSPAPSTYATSYASAVQRNSSIPSPAEGLTSVNRLVQYQTPDTWADKIPNWIFPAANVAAGAADSVSMGATEVARSALGYDDAVNKDSTAYRGAYNTAEVVQTVVTPGKGLGQKVVREGVEAMAPRAVSYVDDVAGMAGRIKGDRLKSADDKLQQLKEIEEAQRKVRQSKSDQTIDSIKKSEQNAKKQLREIADDPSILDDLP